ncbi:MAG: hypothetical protein ACI4M9_04180, partial [Succinivibrio sp.]
MRFLDLFSIKQKLIASYIMLIAASVVLGIVSMYILLVNRDVSNMVHVTLNERYVRVKTVSDNLVTLHKKLHVVVDKIAVNDNDKKELKNMADNLMFSSDKLQTARYPEEIGEIKQATAKYISMIPDLINLIESHKTSEANIMYYHTMLEPLVIIQHNVSAVNSSQTQIINTNIDRINDNGPIFTVVAIIIIEIISAVIIVIQMPRLLVSSIRAAIKVAKSLAAGDLQNEVRIRRHDEFLPLLMSMEKMRSTWHDNVSLIKDVSKCVSQSMSILQDSSESIDISARENLENSKTVSDASDRMVNVTGNIAENCQEASAT